MPGDGGYERRLYSILNMACIPVIINAAGVSFPKIPFPASVPWHKFSFFWFLDPSNFQTLGDGSAGFSEGLFRSGTQLLQQLLALNSTVLARKREALLRYAPYLGWFQSAHCSKGPRAL